MAIPKFEDFLYPFLYRLKDMDNVSIKDMKKSIIGHFHLTERRAARPTNLTID